MKKIVEFEIKNSPNKAENGVRYFKESEHSFSTTNMSLALIHTREADIKGTLNWIAIWNEKHSDYCMLENVRVIDLESL